MCPFQLGHKLIHLEQKLAVAVFMFKQEARDKELKARTLKHFGYEMPSRGYPVYSIVKEPCCVTRCRFPSAAASQQSACWPAAADGSEVENTGLEPVTSGLQSRRSPN